MASLYDMVMMGGPGDVTTGDIAARMPPAPGRARSLADYLGGMQGALPTGPLQAGRRLYNDPSLANALMFGLSMAPGQPLELTKMGLGTMRTGAEGVDNIQRGYNESDPLRFAGGVGQVGLAGLSVAPAGGPVARALTGTAPRAVASTAIPLGMSTIPLAAAEARDANNKLLEGITPPAHLVQALEQARQRQQALLTQQQQLNAQHRRSGAETQRQALAPLNKMLDDEAAKIAKIEGDILADQQAQLAKKREELPFRERSPNGAMAIMGTGALLAGGIPFAGQLKHKITDALAARRVDKLANGIIDGLQETGRKGVSDARLAMDMERLRQSVWPQGWQRTAMRAVDEVGTGIRHMGGAAMSGLTMGEASSMPEQIDYFSFPPGHPTREAAAQAFRNPDYYKERLVPALSGAGAYLTGVKAANLVPMRSGVPDYAAVDTALGIGSPQFATNIQKVRDARALLQTPKAGNGQKALPPPEPPGGNLGGNPGGQQPGQGGAGPGPQPGRPQENIRGPKAQNPYADLMQDRWRAALAKDMEAGKVPTLADFSAYATAEGLNKLPKGLKGKFDNLARRIGDLKATGLDNKTVAELLYKWMQEGKSNLPAIAVGAGLTASQWPSDQ